MLNGTPCVILEGSGRIADVIAQVAGLPVSKVTISYIQLLMKRFFGLEYESFKSRNIIEWTKKVCEPQTKPTVPVTTEAATRLFQAFFVQKMLNMTCWIERRKH